MIPYIEQIQQIIASRLAGYTINFQDENIAPSVFVDVSDVDSESLQIEQTFLIRVRATSEENLLDALKILLKLNSEHPSGYGSITIGGFQSVSPSSARVIFNDAGECTNTEDQTEGAIGIGYHTYLTFDLSKLDYAPTSVILHLTPKQTYATVPDTPTLFALIVAKLSVYIMRLNESRRHLDTNVQISAEWLTFSELDKNAILGNLNNTTNENLQSIWMD